MATPLSEGQAQRLTDGMRRTVLRAAADAYVSSNLKGTCSDETRH